MTTPQPLYSAEIPLGLGHTARITVVEIAPDPAPPTGVTWPTETDWPRCQLSLLLPCASTSELAGDLVAGTEILGEQAGRLWGDYAGGFRRSRLIEARAEYVAEAVAQLRERAESDLAPLIAHVAARAARLQIREERIARGRAGRVVEAAPEVLPIECDDKRVVAPTTDCGPDDSSQRFALLELDTTAPATPARSRRRKAA